MIASITLDQFRCLAETDSGGSTPYLWIALMQIDDDTINSGALSGAALCATDGRGKQAVVIERHHGSAEALAAT